MKRRRSLDAQTNAPGWRLRDFRWDDIPALVEIALLIYPDEPTTVAQYEHWERTYPKDNPRLRYVVETDAGQVVASGACLRPFWLDTVGVYWLDGEVHPQWRRRGIGAALQAALEPFGRAQGATRLWTSCREDFAHTVRFLERGGYIRFGVRFESKLDLTTFDETPFVGACDRARAADYELTTLAAERAGQPDADRQLYDLYCAILRDVPLPGGARFEQTYENFRSFHLESPDADPAGIFIAKRAGQYVGMTSVELLKNGPAITSTTGVRREHRGQGLAMALKLTSFRFLRERGYSEARSHNDTANPPILRLNEKLGYQRLPGWLQREKLLE